MKGIIKDSWKEWNRSTLKRLIKLLNSLINHLVCFVNVVDFIDKKDIFELYITKKSKQNLLKCKIFEREHIARLKCRILVVKIDFRKYSNLIVLNYQNKSKKNNKQFSIKKLKLKTQKKKPIQGFRIISISNKLPYQKPLIINFLAL